MKQKKRLLIFWIIIIGVMSVIRILLGSVNIFADHDILSGSMNLIIGFIFSFVSILYFRMYKRDENQMKLELVSVLPISFITINLFFSSILKISFILTIFVVFLLAFLMGYQSIKMEI